MKLLKYAFITLAVAIVLDGCLVLADVVYPSVEIATTLQRNDGQFTSFYEKNTWATQTYYNRSTRTALTNPCTDCQIGVRFLHQNGDGSGELSVKIGQTKMSNTTLTSEPGVYRLQLRRIDFSLINTDHFGTWHINQ